MVHKFPKISLATVLLALSLTATASATTAPRGWATINICDTALHPNEIGVRAQMFSIKRVGVAFMRFQLQYRTAANKWQLLSSSGADSGFKRIGKANRSNQAGWTFELKPPKNATYVVRGLVTLKWAVSGPDRIKRVVTQSGHPNTVHAEPENYSESLCTVS